MDIGREGATDGTRIDLQGRGDDAQIDIASAVASRAFGGGISLRIPFWKATAIEAEAGRVQNLDADKTLIGSGGPIGQKSREQLKAEQEEESRERLSTLLALVEDQREFEEWLRTKSSIGGVEMTGREWGEFADRLRNDEKLRQKIIDAFEAQGMSEAEANSRYERVTNVADAMKVPPSQRTEEQTALIEKAKTDPAFGSDIKTANGFYSGGQAPKAEVARTAAPTSTPVVAALDGPGM